MMKKFLSVLALVSTLGFGFIGNTYAEDAAPAAEAAATVAAPEAAKADAAPAAAGSAAALHRACV